MIQHWISPEGFKETLFFSPIAELTNIFDDTLRLQIVVGRFWLLENGWIPL